MTNRAIINARGITSRVWVNLSASFDDCFAARDRIFFIIKPFVYLCAFASWWLVFNLPGIKKWGGQQKWFDFPSEL